MTDCFFLIYRPIDNYANDQTVHGYYHNILSTVYRFVQNLRKLQNLESKNGINRFLIKRNKKIQKRIVFYCNLSSAINY